MYWYLARLRVDRCWQESYKNQIGWETLNMVVAPPLLLLAGWLLWLKRGKEILVQQPIH